MRRFATFERALYEESHFGNVAVLECLFRLADGTKESDVAYRADILSLCLTVSCRHNHAAAAHLFLHNGAHIDGASEGSLCAALSGGHITLAKNLLSLGASVQGRIGTVDARVLPPAAETGNLEIVQLVLAKANGGPHWGIDDALVVAVRAGFLPIVSALLSHGANIGFDSGRPLLEAVRTRNTAILALLLSRTPSDADAGRALTLAARLGFKDVVEVLLDLGLDVNAMGGVTLIEAVRGRAHVDVVKVLLDRGADVTLVGVKNLVWTAGWYEDNDAVLEILLEHIGVTKGGDWGGGKTTRMERRRRVEQMLRQFEERELAVVGGSDDSGATLTLGEYQRHAFPWGIPADLAPTQLDTGAPHTRLSGNRTGRKVAAWWRRVKRRVGQWCGGMERRVLLTFVPRKL
ncbi:ankyrin [Gonapodya prolifera JEL478]|uniref:Ankyrin n=1 Tax=Gonapodya prolifera (strain JEL478) TaxID=1344416 RepID=A0A139A588_GONPJ|nr:ankyrin [Gonapodya prolifera JEL478]|eukprot:KXS11977.1 ankyrin [Gonapodya prolifera JEL478]